MGAIFAVVGPSGAGKDSLMEAAKARLPNLHLVRRVITRPEAFGGENFVGVTKAEFDRRVAAGGFALHWPAHGLRYGIPVAVFDAMDQDRTVLFNGSRAMLAEAGRVFPDLCIVNITARRDVLAARLTARGRENAQDITRRLGRAVPPLPPGLREIQVDNSGALHDALEKFVAAVSPVRA